MLAREVKILACFLVLEASALVVRVPGNLKKNTNTNATATSSSISSLRNAHHHGPVVHSPPTVEKGQRDLQLLPEFSANYSVVFQVIRDASCISDTPTLRLYCQGSNIQVLNTSDPSIVCDTTRNIDEDGYSFLDCNFTCTSSECESVYLNVDGASSDGPFGEVEYQCGGAKQEDVDTLATFLDAGSGVCSTRTGVAFERIFHVLRMGVSCPVEVEASNSTVVGGAVVEVNREYVYDDSYFECIPGYDSFASAENHYQCLSGGSCEGITCQINLTQSSVTTDSSKFVDRCVVGSVPITSPPSPAPADGEASLSIIARFQAAWSLIFDPLTAASCNGYIPTVKIVCKNSKIVNVNATSSMNCTNITTSVMTCSDTVGANSVNKFTNVIYECSGPSLPDTSVEFMENEAYCVDNVLEGTVTHAVQLGVSCKDVLGEYYFGDLFVDCVGVSPIFGKMDEFASTDSDNSFRYTCSEAVTVPAFSSESEALTIPTLAIETDESWTLSPDLACRQIIRPTLPPIPNTVAPITDTTSMPVSSPITMSPAPTEDPTNSAVTLTEAPTQVPNAAISPTAAPSTNDNGSTPASPNLSTLAPQVAPTLAPQMAPQQATDITASSPGDQPRNGNGGSSNIGAVVGGASAGVVVVLIVIVAFIVMRKNGINKSGQSPSDDKTFSPTNPPTNHDNSEAEVDTGYHNQHGYPPPSGSQTVNLQSSGIRLSNEDAVGDNVHSDAEIGPSQVSSAPDEESDIVLQPYVAHDAGRPSASYHNTTSISTGSSSSPHRRSGQHSVQPVQFKDQARSVLYEVPMADVEPVMATAVSISLDNSDAASVLTGDTGPTRKSIDP